MSVTPLQYQRIDSLNTNLAQCATLNQDVIHDLRVEIKALRAIYPVLEQRAECKSFDQEPFSTLMKVFKKSGKLRLVQVNIDLASGYPLQKDGILYLKLQKRRQKAEINLLNFLEAIDKKALKHNLDILSKRISKFVTSADVDRVQLQMDRNLKRIMSLKVRAMTVRNIHRIRSLVKQQLALTSFASEFEIPVRNVPDLVALKQIAHEIGVWHDAVEFEYFLENLLQKHSSESLLQVYDKTKSENLNEMNLLYRKLGQLFNDGGL